MNNLNLKSFYLNKLKYIISKTKFIFENLSEYGFLYPLKLSAHLIFCEIIFFKSKKLSAEYQNFSFSRNMITDTKPPDYYKNTYHFNFMDSFSLNVFTWESIFRKYKLKRLRTNYLEIGCFEGRASVFVLEQLNKSFCYFVDPFEEYEEMTLSTGQNNYTSIFENFSKNIQEFEGRYEVHKTTSDLYFEKLNPSKKFDLVYVDGSHLSQDVYRDAINVNKHLKSKGLLIFDDFFWSWYKDLKDNPFFGITKFLFENIDNYKIVYLGDQLILRKK